MNIVQKVNNREITPRHNNYQEVTVDAAGNGPIISFEGVHARTGGLAGLSPLKQTWLDKAQKYADVAGFSPWGGWAVDGVNSLVSLARAGYHGIKGEKEKAKKHLGDSAFRAVMMIPGLDLIKGGKMLKNTGNVKKSVKALNPGFKPGTFGKLEGALIPYEYDQTFNEGKWTKAAVDKFNEGLQKEFGRQKINFNQNIKKPVEDRIEETFKIEGKDATKQEYEDYNRRMMNPNGGVTKPKNYDTQGASTNKKLRKIQESRGYYRNK